MLLPFVPASRQSARRQRLSSAVRSVAESLEGRVLLSASLVKDINMLGESSNPDGFVDVNGVTLFAATDPERGTELWRTDGTAAGTSLVKDIAPGQASSSPQDLVQLNGAVYFAARGPDGGGIWKTDGTAAGTTEVVALANPTDNAQYLTPLGNKLFFLQGNNALWVTDGTPGSAHQLSTPSFLSVVGAGATDTLLPVGNELFFEGVTPGQYYGYGLFKTDGTNAGTTLVQSLGLDTYVFTPVPVITSAGGKVLFNTADSNSAVWETDGTGAGTVQLTPDDVKLLGHAVAFNGSVYFTSQYPQPAIWKTDGTAAGTSVFAQDAGFPFPTVSGRYLFYFAGLGATESELYRTDGTSAGTVQLTWQPPGGILSGQMTDVNGELFFSGYTTSNFTDMALWKSDGTVTGTSMVKDLPGGLNPINLAGIGGKLYFSANDGIHGQGLWTSDGTAAGTVPVTALGSNPTDGLDVNGELFFVANDGIHGPELWKSDGTSAGTIPVVAGSPIDLTNVNGTLYFLEDVSQAGSVSRKLFRSDGTPAGTIAVADVQPGASGQLTNVNGVLYFVNGQSVWRTDPSTNTATPVASLAPGVSHYLIPLGNKLLDGSGTDASGGPLSELVGNTPGPLGNGPVFHRTTSGVAPAADVLNGLLYYIGAVTPPGSTEPTEPVLYRTDGTPAGTVAVRAFANDRVTAVDQGEGTELYNIAGKLMFNLNSGIWVSDGTASGTSLFQSNLQLTGRPVMLKGLVYYLTYDSQSEKLWRTDLTPGGTVLLKQLPANLPISDPRHSPLRVFDNHVYFAEPLEQMLWQADGTPWGTVPVPGIPYDTSGQHSNSTNILAVSGGKLYFSPSDPQTGNELWKLDAATGAITISGTSANDTITLSVASGGILQASVNGNTTSYTAAQYGGGITIDTGSSSGAGDLLNIVGLPPVAVQVQSEGPLSVYVGGGSRGMQDVAATTLTIGAAGAGQGKISLTLDDGADTTARSVTLDAANSANAAYGTVTGLSAGTIAFNAKQTVSPVTIYAGGGGNSITVNHTPAGPNINLSTGAGNDTVNVLATAAGTVLNVNGKSGTDTVNVGGANQHSLANISGVVNVSNPLGQTHLTIDDSADPASRTATLDTFTAGADVYGSLTGLSPGPIDFDSTQVAPPVVIDAGNGGNHFVVKQTPPATVINLNTGNGNDTVNVSAAGAGTVLNINGQAGQDAVNIGDSGVNSVGLRNINGVVNVSNPLGATAITADNTDGLNGDITLDTFDAAGAKWGTLQGLAPGVINFSSVGLGSLFVSAAGNSTALTVKNTPGGGPINFSRIALIEVMGVAAGQSLNIPYGTPHVISANIDLYTGRVAGGVFVDTETLNVRGAAGQTYNGLGAVYNEDTLVDINVSSGTYVLPDLDLTFGHSGITFDGADTHAVFSQAEHLESVALSSGATATLAPGSDLFCQGLTLGGKLDIGTNQVHDPIDAFNSVQQIRDWIKSGLAGGNGITSSAVDATHTIGFSSAGLVRWTLYGDANLDGVVNFSDLLIVAQNYGRTNAYWYQGDFNYDGKVDFADLLKVGQNFGRTTATIAAASAGVNSPQPLDLLALKRRRAHR